MHTQQGKSCKYELLRDTIRDHLFFNTYFIIVMLSTIYSEHAQKLFFILISFTRDLLVSRLLHKYTHAATKSIAFLYNTLWLITAQIQ